MQTKVVFWQPQEGEGERKYCNLKSNHLMVPFPLKISKYYTVHLKSKDKEDGGKITVGQVHTTSSLYLKATSAESRVLDDTGAAVHRP